MPRNNENLTPASVSDNESNGAPRQEDSARSESQRGGNSPLTFADLASLYPSMINYDEYVREQAARVQREMEEQEARLRERMMRAMTEPSDPTDRIRGLRPVPRPEQPPQYTARVQHPNFWVNWGAMLQPTPRPPPAADATIRPMPAPRRRVRNFLHGVTEQIPPGERAVPDPFYWNHTCECGGVECETEDYRYKRCTDECRARRMDYYACPVCGGSGVASGRGPRTQACGGCWGSGRATCEVCGEHDASRMVSTGRPDALCARCVSDSEDACSP